MISRSAIFKWRQTEHCLILCAVRWYLRYSLSLRDVEELLEERGLNVDHTTVWRWVQYYGPELEQRLRRHLKPTNKSWRVDETYVRVKGRWCYLYRAIDSAGGTIDFLLSAFRDADAAKRLFQPLPSPAEDEATALSNIDSRYIQQFVAFLGSSELVKKEGLLTFGFDSGFSSILSVGGLTRHYALEKPESWNLLPSGITTSDQLPTQPERKYRPVIHIHDKKGAVALSIHLDAFALRDGILRYSPNVLTTAALPSEIKMFAWIPSPAADYGYLPFSSDHVDWGIVDIDVPSDYDDYQRYAEQLRNLPRWMHHIRVTITPNGIGQISRTYLMSPIFADEIQRKDTATVRLWEGHAQ